MTKEEREWYVLYVTRCVVEGKIRPQPYSPNIVQAMYVRSDTTKLYIALGIFP